MEKQSPPHQKEPDSDALDKCFKALFLAGLCLLMLVYGAASMYFNKFPSGFFNKAFAGLRAIVKRSEIEASPFKHNYWNETSRDDKGMTIYRPDKCYNGLTLFTSGHACEANLIDMQGKVIHSWNIDFDQVWTDTPHIDNPTPNEFISFNDVYLYPNGDLLAVLVSSADTPWGYGLVKLDKDSNVIWKMDDNVHHPIEVMPNGNIIVLTHRIVEEHQFSQDIPSPYIDDEIVKLSPEGVELKRTSIMYALVSSEFQNAVNYQSSKIFAKEDILHANTVKYITGQTAQQLPFADEGQVMISLRSMDALAVVDLDKQAVVWFTVGPWRTQHDPDILDNGHILLFDNIGHFGPGGQSRLIEFDPVTFKIHWQYTGTAQQPFYSEIRSMQQRLPNGNTLINQSCGGRLFEVTREGEIVWEYLNPEQRDYRGKRYVAVICGGYRFTKDQLPFLN